MKFKVNQVVQFNTTCIWNRCSGTIVKVNESNKTCSVELPDNKTKIEFGFHELEIKDVGSKIELQINIARKGKGNTDTFTGSYTMMEHAYDKPVKDGKAFAAKKYPNEDCAVHISPLDNPELERAVADEFNLGKEYHVIPKIHNPLKSCFTAYKHRTIAGSELLIYKVSSGICFAEVNTKWVNESKAA